MRLKLFLSFFFTLIFCFTSTVNAWEPTKTITMIVAYKKGSCTDIGARLLSSYAERFLGQKMIVKNIDGDDGAVGWRN